MYESFIKHTNNNDGNTFKSKACHTEIQHLFKGEFILSGKDKDLTQVYMIPMLYRTTPCRLLEASVVDMWYIEH